MSRRPSPSLNAGEKVADGYNIHIAGVSTLAFGMIEGFDKESSKTITVIHASPSYRYQIIRG